MKFNKKFLFILFCFLLARHSLGEGGEFVKPVLAQHFESNSYIIEWGNFNMTGGTKVSTNYHLSDTVGQMAPGEYNSGAYTLEAGFQYIYNTFNKFRFTINDPDLAIDFGHLVPGIGSTAYHSITISCPAAHGYEILAKQNHPLQILSSGTTIPNTSCNIGSTCTPSSSATWDTTNSYGFGYNVIGTNISDVPTGVGSSQYFTDISKFRPFDTIGQYIMSENHPVSNRKARITYKSLISVSQSTGVYSNAITFIAIPNY